MSLLALPHIGFVIAAYAIAAVVIAGLIAWTVLDGRSLRRMLAAQAAENGLADPDDLDR